MRGPGILGLAVLSSACATTMEQPATGDAPVLRERVIGEGGTCSIDRASTFVGRMASSDLGARVLAATGAAVLRWLPPDSAATMDYRPDRVSVSYDRAMSVTALRCG